jgi:hypothetical protein
MGSLSSSVRRTLRDILVRDQADRDAISSALLRYRDPRADEWADVVDLLTIRPDVRRRIVRVLGEMSAEDEG